MPPIEAVLLDAGGVLILPDPEVMRPALHALGLDPDTATLDRAHYAAMAEVDRAWPRTGRQPDRELWTRYRETYVRACGAPEAQVPATADRLAATFNGSAWTRVVPGVVDALRRLAASGVALAVVSNAFGTVAEMLMAAEVCQVGEGAGVPVAVVVDSHLVGVEKPDPRIFHLALAELGVTADRALHVGDTVHADVAGAQAAGVLPVHLDPYGDCSAGDGHLHVRHLTEVASLLTGGGGGQRR